MKTAIVVGATGLVGSYLMEQLIPDDRFIKIIILTRRPTGYSAPKVEEHCIDFGIPGSWKNLVKGDVIFSTMGTTIKKAGTQEVQYLIDHDYPYQVALAGRENGVSACVLVSSAGADPHSRIFYSRMKGELEEDIKNLAFQKTRILQPSILDGNRRESRPMEKAATFFARGLTRIPGLGKYRPVHGSVIARKMIASFFEETRGVTTYTLDEIF